MARAVRGVGLVTLALSLCLACSLAGGARPPARPLVVEDSEIPDQGPSRGPADAPVTIVEFADFRCPHCRTMLPVLDRVLAAYPNDVRLVFVHMPVVSAESGRAAVAAVAAERQGAFWEMHDFLFELQRQPLEEELLRGVVLRLGLDADRFSLDLRSEASVLEVEADLAAAEQLGVRATPAYLVNGRLLEGTQPFEVFRQLIEAELKMVGPRPL